MERGGCSHSEVERCSSFSPWVRAVVAAVRAFRCTGILSEAYKDARNYNFQHFRQKFSGRYKDARRCLQEMRELIQNVSVVDMKGIFIQYATKVSRELPLLHRLQPQQLTETPNNKGLNDGSKEKSPRRSSGI